MSTRRASTAPVHYDVLEAGARFEDGDFPATSFDAKRFLFAPALGMYGIQRIDMVKDCLILAGAGVGGGSLVYANTLYEPLDAFYRDPSWSHITDWRSELAPYYDQARRMLCVVDNPRHTPSDVVMKQVADDMGVGDTFHPTPVGVFFGGPDARSGEEVADPFFGGAGRRRWRRRLRGDRALDQGEAVAAHGHQDLHRRPGRLLRRGARHPEAAPRAQG